MLTLIAQFGNGLQPVTPAFSTGSDTAQGAASNLELLISNMLGAITVVGSLFFIVYFLSAALTWITAGADSGKLQKSRDKMTMGVIGLVLMVMSYGIIGLVGRVVGLDLLRPGQTILEQLNPAGMP